MISLRKSWENQERVEIDLLLSKTRECYLRAIEIIEKHAVELSPDDGKDHRSKLGQLRRRVLNDFSVNGLDDSSLKLETEVREHNSGVSKAFQNGKEEVKEIIALLREATGTLANGNAQHDAQLRAFASNLEQTSECEDLREMRLCLTRQVVDLRAHIETITNERAETLKPLTSEIRSFEERLQEAERLASTDPLTNLFNRREGDKRASAKLQDGKTICLMVIDLNRFKWINDRFGHLAGDQVLIMAARKLEQQVRSMDFVCRWGGDEFLVVLECKLSVALARSRDLAQFIQGSYRVTVNGRKIEVIVTASIGVAQCEPGDDIEAAFERADEMLYQIKHKSQAR